MEAMLSMLKVDLGLTTDAYDERLTQYLASAAAMLSREGVKLTDGEAEDMQLQVMYARWLWNRRDGMEGMPRMLRWHINQRVCAASMAEEDTSDDP